LTERQESRAFDEVAVELRGGGGTLRPARVRVSISGQRSAVERLTRGSIRAVVDMKDQARPRRLRVMVELPPGLTLDGVEPEEIWVAPQRGS
jgi:hypothetical protein